MKKILFFAAVATLFAACTKDATESIATAKPDKKLHVSIETADSRVQLTDGITTWNKGDSVSVFYGNIAECWRFDGNTGDTSGTLSKLSETVSPGSLAEELGRVAVYPYSETNSPYWYDNIRADVQPVQNYRPDSYGAGSNIMLAVDNAGRLEFKNVLGWIKVSLTGDKVLKNIVLSGNNEENLSGTILIKINDLSIYYVMGGERTVTVDCGDGVALSKNPTDFYFSVIPQTFEHGFNIVATDTDGNIMVKKTEKCITVERNHIVTFSSAEYKPSEPYIYYTTSDGQIITPFRFDAEIISNTYENGQGIIHFDRPLTSIGGHAFYNCSSLTSIDIPDGVTSIGDYAFESCSSLTSITIPDGVTSIGDYAFYNCSSLTSITIPDGVTSIGDYAFESCSSLTSITIPGSVTEIGSWIFGECYNLEYIYGPLASKDNKCLIINNCLTIFIDRTDMLEYTVPDGVTSIGRNAFGELDNLISIKLPDSVIEIGDGAFSSCWNLETVSFGNGLKTIGSCAFDSCTYLTAVAIPDSIVSIGSEAFYHCENLKTVSIGDGIETISSSAFVECENLEEITIGKNIKSIEEGALYGCKKLKTLYCKATTPPALASDALRGVPTSVSIFVPMASVEAYKAALNWKRYASKIAGYDFAE